MEPGAIPEETRRILTPKVNNSGCKNAEDTSTCEEAPDRWILSPAELSKTGSISFGEGMDMVTERKLRQESAQFIFELGSLMKLRVLDINTAVVYMHRFYIKHPFQIFDRLEMALTCILVAAKLNDDRRGKINGILFHANSLLQTKPITPEEIINWRSECMKERIFQNEEVLLQTLGFETAIVMPHVYIANACGMLNLPLQVSKLAYQMANRSFIYTGLCIQYHPAFVACAAIIGAANLTKYKIPESKDWCPKMEKSIKLEELDNAINWFITMCKPQNII